MGRSDHDAELMTATQQGDADAFSTLVGRYAAPLLGFVIGLVRRRPLAEEIVQDAFLQVWKVRSAFDVRRPFKPWLYRIAINRCHELARKRQEEPDATLDRPGDDSPLGPLLAAEQEEHVRHAVGKLAFGPRAVVMLRVWEGMSYAEIATLLNIPEGTARSHMHHALATLRTELAALVLE